MLQAGIGGGEPVVGAYFEWNGATDLAGDSVWTSKTANAYSWTFGSSQTPAVVSDPRFGGITNAYAFPAAKATGATFDGYGDQDNASFEFVIDVDGDNGVIFETGGGWVGTQFDMHGGDLRFHVHAAQSVPPDTLSVALSPEDTSRLIHVVGVLDLINDDMLLYVDGQLVSSNTNFTTSDWGGNGVSGLGQINGDGASTDSPDGVEAGDFSGKIALFRYYRGKALTPTEVEQNFDSLFSGSSVLINLDGTVNDLDGDPLTTTWVATNGPAAVVLGNAAEVDTTATFTQEGVYVLRLTADDGYGPVYDEVTITVSSQTVTTNHMVPYQWLTDTLGVTNDYEQAVTNDTDGDGFSNWEEYWSGTNPNSSNSYLKIDSITLTGTNVVLEWEHFQVGAIPDITIQVSSNLIDGPWLIRGSKSPADGMNSWSNSGTHTLYYRLAVTNAP
jgi:hypothetical protein